MSARRASFSFLFRGLVAVGLSSICACATGGASGASAEESDGKTYLVSYRPDEAKFTGHVDRSADDIWNALGPALQDLGYKGGPSIHGDERLYMTPTLRVPGHLYEGEWNSAYLDCGRTPAGTLAADSYELTFAVLVWVDADKPTGSTVRILVNGWGHDRTNPSAIVRCSGTGRLEAGFMEAIERRLKLAS